MKGDERDAFVPVASRAMHRHIDRRMAAALCPCVSLPPCKASCHCADPWSDAACQRCDGSGMIAPTPPAPRSPDAP